MSHRIVIRRHGFAVHDSASGSVQPLDLDPRDQLPLLVGLLFLSHSAKTGVPMEEIQSHPLFNHLSLDNCKKIARRHVARYASQVKTRAWALPSIIYGTGSPHGSFHLILEPDTELELAEDARWALCESPLSQSGNWQRLPAHHRPHLKAFVAAISAAASLFDTGAILPAQEKLAQHLNLVEDPRYKAVILFRLARAHLRQAKEDEARTILLQATTLVDALDPPDPILLARVQYNKAWVEYTRGNFSYEPILKAQKALERAGPDDIRHGFVATQFGLVVIKELQQKAHRLTPVNILAKGHEALTYLTHAVYLLARSEDFWGAQEACWNLAFGLFQIGNLDSMVTPQLVGTPNQNYLEILSWIELSDSITTKHTTGGDSRRNSVLRASVEMERKGDLDAAQSHLPPIATAEDEQQLALTTSPRELGRIYERWTEYYIRRAEDLPLERKKWIGFACETYDKADGIWRKHQLNSLITNDLEVRYHRVGKSVRWRKRRELS